MKVQWFGRTALAVRRIFPALFLGLALSGGFAFAQAQQEQFTPQVEDPESFPPGEGRDDTFYTCSACHAFKLVASQGFSRERWDETIDLMVDRHGMAKPEAKDREILLNYLASAFPPKASPRGFQNPFLKQ